MKIALVVPHIFLHREILPQVIFSPGQLALNLAEGLQALGAEVTLFSPGPAPTQVPNMTADLSYFEAELAGRGDTYLDLLRKHPFTFVSLARQVQAELVAKAYALASTGQFDVVHIYTNEEDIALPFAQLCGVPVVFTHHDPFNFLVKYKNVFPKYAHLNWLSMSHAQRQSMPAHTNWVGNIYHGLAQDALSPVAAPAGKYVVFLGRIIQTKGVHLAIAAVQEYNATAKQPLRLKIAGKHYAGQKDEYWHAQVLPHLDGEVIEYVGFADSAARQELLANATALLMPSTFEEPFGMVAIEALACGTPVVGLNSGAIPELLKPGVTGVVVPQDADERVMVAGLARGIAKAQTFDRMACRRDFEARFTLARMCQEHLEVYQRITKSALI